MVTDLNQREEHARVLIPGSLFGEIGVLCNCKRTATVICRAFTTAAYLQKEDFENLCVLCPDVAMNIKEGMNQYSDRNQSF